MDETDSPQPKISQFVHSVSQIQHILDQLEPVGAAIVEKLYRHVYARLAVYLGARNVSAAICLELGFDVAEAIDVHLRLNPITATL